jgi:hypothetical protein
MREYNFFSTFKVTLKIHFLSESTSVKITKFNFKSTGDNFKIPAFLFFNGFVKNDPKMTFLHLLRTVVIL